MEEDFIDAVMEDDFIPDLIPDLIIWRMEDDFIDAVFEGDVESVKRYIHNNGGDVNYRRMVRNRDHGVTGLWVASEKGHTNIVRVLLEHEADPNIHNEDCYGSLLIEATSRHHTDIVRLLLEHGADVNAHDKDTCATSLVYASKFGHTDIVIVLLEHGANPNIQNHDSAITDMSERNHIALKMLLKITRDFWAWGSSGATPLTLASMYDRTDIVTVLLEHGADPNIKNVFGWAPLMYASARGYTDMVRVLLKYGANPNVQNMFGETSLILASEDIATLLIEHDRNVDIWKVLEARLHGAGQWQPPNYSCIQASENDYTDIVRMLLEHGADFNIKNNNGKTALDVTTESGIKLLIQNQNRWNRRKALMTVLAENGYIQSPSSHSFIIVNTSPPGSRLENVFSNECLLRHVVAYI